MAKKIKLPADMNKHAKLIVDLAIGAEMEPHTINEKAIALGKLGGLKGGNARAKALSPKRRSEIAKKAAAARWKS